MNNQTTQIHAVAERLATRLTGEASRKPAARRATGFTLIELLLVLVILGILAAVVVPKFTRRSEDARITAAKTDISNVEVALDAFEVDNGRFPNSSEGLKALVEQPSGMDTWKGPYIKRELNKDPWGNPYIYKSPGNNNTMGYDLYSSGPNGVEGDTDDVVNWTR